MPRKSTRLQEAGYYTEQGTPFFSYREVVYRVFRRRKRFPTRIPINPTYTEGLNHMDDIAFDLPFQQNTNSTMNRNYQASALLIEVTDAETNNTLTLNPDDRTFANQKHETQEKENQTTELGPMTKTSEIQTIKSKEDNAKTSRSSFWNLISTILLLLLLLQTFGNSGITADNNLHLEEIQEKLRSFQQRIYQAFPLSDTMSNFALESQGARTLQHLSTDTYWPQENINFLWDKIFHWWYSSKKLRGVIQGHSTLKPGECWPFSGIQGHLFISLSHAASITHVTLSHITKSQSPHGDITSAPRQFSVYGMTTTDEEGTLLGRMVYNQDGTPHQTFALPNPDKGIFRYVKLQIENNWGNIDNTCLYSFRVHGKTQPTTSEVQ